MNLQRCQISITPGEEQACSDEKKAFEKAKRRLRTAEEKVHVVQHWHMKLKHESEEFEAQMARFRHSLESELPRGIAALQRMIRALDQYTQHSAPSESPAGAGGSSAVQVTSSDDLREAPGEVKP